MYIAVIQLKKMYQWNRPNIVLVFCTFIREVVKNYREVTGQDYID